MVFFERIVQDNSQLYYLLLNGIWLLCSLLYMRLLWKSILYLINYTLILKLFTVFYCIVQHFTIIYSTVPYSTVFYYIIVHCRIMYFILWWNKYSSLVSTKYPSTISYCLGLYVLLFILCFILYCIISYCTLLYIIIL